MDGIVRGNVAKEENLSLYNLLFGVNKIAPLLLFILDIDQPDERWDSGRFRDIYLNEDGTKIILYTRNGGGNRPHWGFSYAKSQEGEDCRCPGCIISYKLPKHPNYISDYDDDFDSTYACVEFDVPEQFKEIAEGLATGKKPESIHEKFNSYIERLKAGKERVPDEIENIFKKIIKALAKEKLQPTLTKGHNKKEGE